MLRIDARTSKPLQAVILALRDTDKTIQGQIRRQSKAVIVPEFKSGLAQQADRPLQFPVLVATASATVSNQNVKLSAATKGRALRGGLSPKENYGVVEFGANRGKRLGSYKATSKRGRSFTVRNRRTQAQLPPFKRGGYVFYPTVADIVPRVFSLWAQTTVRVFGEALEGKSRG